MSYYFINERTKSNSKFILIYLPFLAISIGFLVLYTFLHWLLFIQINFVSLKEELLMFWFPLTLPWIPIYIWLNPSIKLLNCNHSTFCMVTCLAIGVPTIIAQDYLVKATGRLTRLDNITLFEKSRPTKYYSLDHYYIDNIHIGTNHSVTITGGTNKKLNLCIYITLPIFTNRTDPAKGGSTYWLGKEYTKSISNRLSKQEKETAYEAFVAAAQQEFESTNFQDFSYLERLESIDCDAFNNAVKHSELYNKAITPIIFRSIKHPFESRNEGTLAWILVAFILGTIVYAIMILCVKLKSDETAKVTSQKGSKIKDSPKEGLKSVLGFLIPRKDFFVTPIILHLNILLYLIMACEGLGFMPFKEGDLLNWAANHGPSIGNGQWWRLLTSIFIHNGLIHLSFNMISLLGVSTFLEPLLGRVKYVITYITTGILASSISIWWHPETISVGASGAIFGLYGVLVTFLLLEIFGKEFSKEFLLTSISPFLVYNLSQVFTNSSIDHAAHIGGLLSGCIIGWLLGISLKKRDLEENL